MKRILFIIIVLSIFSCNKVIEKKCNHRLNFTINGQLVPSKCDIVGVPEQNDFELLALVDIKEEMEIKFFNPLLKNNPDLTIKLGDQILPYNRKLRYKLNRTGFFYLQVCLDDDCMVKYVLVDENPKERLLKNREQVLVSHIGVGGVILDDNSESKQKKTTKKKRKASRKKKKQKKNRLNTLQQPKAITILKQLNTLLSIIKIM